MPDWYIPTDEPSIDVLAVSFDIRIDEFKFIDTYFEQFPVMGEQYGGRYVIIYADESGLHSQGLDNMTSLLTTATTTVAGTDQLATLAEVNTGTIQTKFVTPYTHKNKTPAIITEATTARTLTNTDKNAIILCTNSADVTITLPLDATEDFDDGWVAHVVQAGTGVVTVVGEGAVIVSHALSAETRKQYAMLSIMKVAVDEYKLIGDQAG